MSVVNDFFAQLPGEAPCLHPNPSGRIANAGGHDTQYHDARRCMSLTSSSLKLPGPPVSAIRARTEFDIALNIALADMRHAVPAELRQLSTFAWSKRGRQTCCHADRMRGGSGSGGGGGESFIKDLKREANALSRDTRQAIALGLEGGPPPLKNCSARHDQDPYSPSLC
jgi:hypothetical protein